MQINYRPEQRTAAILLVLAILAVVAYLFVAVVPRLWPASSSGTEVTDAVPAGQNTDSAPAAQPAPGNAAGQSVAARAMNPADVEMESGAMPGPTRDPFRPPVPTAVAPAVATASTFPTPPPSSPIGPRAGGTWRMSGGPGLPDFGPGTLRPDLSTRIAPVAPPPAPVVALKGVLPGEPAVAVLGVGGQTLYRQEGGRVPGGLEVARITEAGIVLRQGKRIYPLEVGQSVRPDTVPPGTGEREPETRSAPKTLDTGATGVPLPTAPEPARPVRATASPEAGTERPAVRRSASTRRRSVRRSRVRHRRHAVRRRGGHSSRRITSRSTRWTSARHFAGRRL